MYLGVIYAKESESRVTSAGNEITGNGPHNFPNFLPLQIRERESESQGPVVKWRVHG